MHAPFGCAGFSNHSRYGICRCGDARKSASFASSVIAPT